MSLGNQRDRLIDQGDKIDGSSFPEMALRESVFELAYILQRIEELTPFLETEISSASEAEQIAFLEAHKVSRFYSQCLLLWSNRILEILKSEVPPALRLARNILAAHYGAARGNLTSKLTRERGFLISPKFSSNGSLQYVIASLDGPASIANHKELGVVKELFNKYCPNGIKFNPYDVCYKVLHYSNSKINDEDVDTIMRFIRNNGGVIADSQSIIEYVINSLEKHLA